MKAASSTPIQSQQVSPKLESTTIHRILEENINSQGGKLIVEADISRADLNPLVKGHKVNGIPLCTPVRSPSKLQSKNWNLTGLCP